MKGYVLIADILGYSQIIQNLDDNELSSRIQEWLKLIDSLINQYEHLKYSLLSDTLFITALDTKEGLESNGTEIDCFATNSLVFTAHNSLTPCFF